MKKKREGGGKGKRKTSPSTSLTSLPSWALTPAQFPGPMSFSPASLLLLSHRTGQTPARIWVTPQEHKSDRVDVGLSSLASLTLKIKIQIPGAVTTSLTWVDICLRKQDPDILTYFGTWKHQACRGPRAFVLHGSVT